MVELAIVYDDVIICVAFLEKRFSMLVSPDPPFNARVWLRQTISMAVKSFEVGLTMPRPHPLNFKVVLVVKAFR